jgi:hypothetical protein
MGRCRCPVRSGAGRIHIAASTSLATKTHLAAGLRATLPSRSFAVGVISRSAGFGPGPLSRNDRVPAAPIRGPVDRAIRPKRENISCRSHLSSRFHLCRERMKGDAARLARKHIGQSDADTGSNAWLSGGKPWLANSWDGKRQPGSEENHRHTSRSITPSACNSISAGVPLRTEI